MGGLVDKLRIDLSNKIEAIHCVGHFDSLFFLLLLRIDLCFQTLFRVLMSENLEQISVLWFILLCVVVLFFWVIFLSWKLAWGSIDLLQIMWINFCVLSFQIHEQEGNYKIDNDWRCTYTRNEVSDMEMNCCNWNFQFHLFISVIFALHFFYFKLIYKTQFTFTYIKMTKKLITGLVFVFLALGVLNQEHAS